MTPDDLLEVWQGTPELHLVVGPGGDVLDANPVAQDLGICPGSNLKTFGDGRTRARIARLLRRARSGHRPSAELTLDLHGRSRRYQVQAVPLSGGSIVLGAHKVPQVHLNDRSALVGRDPLTGLVDRSTLRDRLELALRRAQRSRTGVGLMYLDVDDFKGVNDRLGHAFGDAVLIGIATRVQPVLRSADTLARLGGDEFVIVCEEVATPHDLDLLAKRVATAVSDEPFTVGTDTAAVSCSVGVAYTRTEGLDIDMFLRAADDAMYSAKRHGPGLQRSVFVEERVDRVGLGLQRAIARGTLPISVQPVRSLRGGALIGHAVDVAVGLEGRAAVALEALAKHQPTMRDLALLIVRQSLSIPRPEAADELQVHVPLLALTDPAVREALIDEMANSGWAMEDFVFAVDTGGARSLRALAAVQDAFSGNLRLALVRFGTDVLDLGAVAALRPEICEIAPQLVGSRADGGEGRLRATCAAAHELGARTQVFGVDAQDEQPGLDQVRSPLGESLQRLPSLSMKP